MSTQSAELRGKRRPKNDIIHVWRDSEERPACGSRLQFIGSPSDQFDLAENEYKKDYLMRDGSVEGKICGRCRNALDGTVGE